MGIKYTMKPLTPSQVACVLLAGLFACSAEPTPAEPTANASPRMIQPGESTQQIDSLVIFDKSTEPDESEGGCSAPSCAVVYDMCQVMAPFPDSVAILEYERYEYFSIDRHDYCGHHRSNYARFSFKTIGVVAGAEVPEELTATVYTWTQADGPSQLGEVFLVSLYKINEEWFAELPYGVTLNGSVEVQDTSTEQIEEVVLDIPMTFEGLVQKAQAVLADYEPCQQETWTHWTSRQKVHDFLAKPGPRCNEPDFADDELNGK